MQNELDNHLNRGNRKMLTLGCVLGLISATFLVVTARTNINEILGPVAMSPAEILKIEDPSKLFRYYISTTGSGVSPAVYQETMDSIDRKTKEIKSREITSETQLFQLGDKFALLKRRTASADKSAAGALVRIPKDLDGLVADVKSNPTLGPRLLPLMIDTTRFNGGAYWTIGWFGMVIIVSVFLIRNALARLSDKFQNPSIKSLSRLGDPRTLAPEIDQELRETGEVFHSSLIWLTKNWLITSRFGGIDIKSTKELVWIYPKTTSHSVNFIPMGKTYSMIICDSRGNYTSVWLPSQDFQSTLDALYKRAPWAFYGFMPENEIKWKKKNRPAMIAEVEAKRQAMSA